MASINPVDDVALTADLMLCTNPTAREQTVAELLNYLAATWDTLPSALHDHAVAVAHAHSTDPSTLPPRLQEALQTMAKRGPVVELTAPTRTRAEPVVAYRSRDGRQLRCLQHGPAPHLTHLIGVDWHALTAVHVDGDASTCTECGTDVLA